MPHSEMSEDVVPANTDRLAAFESSMRDLIDQNAATLDFLKTFLDKTIAAPPAVTEKPPINT